ncbi:MAG: hypothetical protein ACI94Y_000046 [Maribacter sp.]|jgi:hypothetical protein
MQNILDDNEIIDQEDGYQLRQVKFIKRIRLFSIISLVNAIFLCLLSIGFIIYTIILIDYQYTNQGEVIMCSCGALFSLIGSLFLFKTYKNNNTFAKKPDDTSLLIKGMNYFFKFWLALIFNFVFMGLGLVMFG